MARKPKRARFEVGPQKATHTRGYWAVTKNGRRIFDADFKREAVALAVYAAKACEPSELFIKTRAGRIGKGPSGRRTYGADPRRTKG